ncbi:MAG: TMEM143 family protein [Halioglobus sp.]
MTPEDNQYITVHLADIVEKQLLAVDSDSRFANQSIARQLVTYYLVQFGRQSDQLKSLYRYFNPSVISGRPSIGATERNELKQQFFDQVSALLEAANYRELSIEDIQKAMEEQALFDLSISVNLDDYDRLMVFRRGAQPRKMRLKRWFGRFGEREVDFINYDRVALVFSENTQGSDVHFKLFQNVPRHDIEILLPEPQVRMRLKDKLIIGVPAVVGGFAVLLTKLGPTLLLLGSVLAFWVGMSQEKVELDQGVLIALGVGLFALGGHLWRQFGALKNRRLNFLKVLTENLYFKSLDNNSGAIQQLLDTAADEEVKEVFLVYSFLSVDSSASIGELDQRIEQWLTDTFGCKVNFDIQGAVHKAVGLGLATNQNDRYKALSAEIALDNLNANLNKLVHPD